jgi:hypothetical protein
MQELRTSISISLAGSRTRQESNRRLKTAPQPSDRMGHPIQEHPAMNTITVQKTTALIMRLTPLIAPSTASLSSSQTNRLLRFSKDPKPAPHSGKRTCGVRMHSTASFDPSHIVSSSCLSYTCFRPPFSAEVDGRLVKTY